MLASKASFALDYDGIFYFPGGGNAGGYGVIPRAEAGLSLGYLCGLLNSTLLDLYLKRKSTHFRGGFYSYARRFSGKLPIIVPDTQVRKALAQRIESIVKRLVALNGLSYRVIEQWNTTTTKLKNGERKLIEILEEDGKATREGQFESAWTREVTFYPDSAEIEFTKEFVDFILKADIHEPKLKIYGLTDDNNEELVYQVEFKNRELMLHVFFSILALLESRVKVRSLKELFEKTIIPVIQPDIVRNTPNIIKKLEKDLQEGDLKRLLLAPSHDIAMITDAIENSEAENDAMVGKLYGLNESEMNLVLSSSSTAPSYQQKVLEFFSKGI